MVVLLIVLVAGTWFGLQYRKNQKLKEAMNNGEVRNYLALNPPPDPSSPGWLPWASAFVSVLNNIYPNQSFTNADALSATGSVNGGTTPTFGSGFMANPLNWISVSENGFMIGTDVLVNNYFQSR